MTNEQAKEEAIKKAWNELVGPDNFNALRLDKEVYSDWRCRKLVPSGKLDLLHDRFKIGSSMKSGLDLIYRPKSIRTIDENNGWIRIEPDGSNLPKEGEFKVYWYDEKSSEIAQNFETVKTLFKGGLITHYKPITPELKPIY